MKRLPWKYLAGLIDGEGCLDLQVHKNPKYGFYAAPRVRIVLTGVGGQDVTAILKNSFGGHISHRVPTNLKWADSWEWTITSYPRVGKVLRNIVNHLILKKEQARLILWMEQNVKGSRLSEESLKALRLELSLMKKDAHRLSEKAQENILVMLQSDSL